MVKVKKNIEANAHPPHYMMHKYWGRKPHNVVSEYIKAFTKPGDTVLDPFMGSGVVVIESIKLGRTGIGVDLNPLSCFIAENSISKLEIEKFEDAFNAIYKKCFSKYSDFYRTQCPNCKKYTLFENCVWVEDKISVLKGKCNSCGQFKKKANSFDLAQLSQSKKILAKQEGRNKKYYPKDEILQYVKRSQKTHINQLFSDRALLILGAIREEIFSMPNGSTKNALLLTFSSMLPNVSKMIPGDLKTVNGKSGWVVSKLWAPKIHTEKNIFDSFNNRFKKIKSGKTETNQFHDKSSYKIYNQSSESLKQIKSSSIDYIFTDPPYGESIAYFGLSMFFNAWLKHDVIYNSEIIFDPYRNKKHEDYANRLHNVFKELYRVLKSERYLSFTFHNRDLKIWKCMIEAVDKAGFKLINIVYQEQAVQSGTQGLNFKNTFKGDFVYNYVKESKKNIAVKKKFYEFEEISKKILSKVDQIYKKYEHLTSDKLYEYLIPFVIKNNLYVDIRGEPIDLETIVKQKYLYAELVKSKKIYGWKKK